MRCSRGVLEAPRREPVRLVVGVVEHIRAAVVHDPIVRVGSPVRRSRPPVAVVTDIAERSAVVVATGQGEKAISVSSCISAPKSAVSLELCTCHRSTTHIGLQSIPRRGVGQVPTCGASRQGGSVVVEATVGGAVACRVIVAPGAIRRSGWPKVQILRHPSLGANHNGFVGLFSTGQGIGRSVVGAVLRIGGNRCRRGSRARRRYDGT